MKARRVRVDVNLEELDQIIDRGTHAPLSESDGQKLKTVEGETLIVKKSGGKVMIMDAKGGSATVTIADVNQSNGMIHVVDTVLMPAS